MKRYPVYVSRLMKAHEVLEACRQFKEQEASIRKASFKLVKSA